MTDAEKTAALREAGKLLAKQILDNLAYAATSYAKDPFKIDKRGIVADLRSGLDRLEHAHDMMGVPPAAPKPAVDLTKPPVSSNWRHHSGRVYRVLFMANDVTDPKPEYPVTVVYENIDNGTLWAGRLDDWHRRMSRVER